MKKKYELKTGVAVVDTEKFKVAKETYTKTVDCVGVVSDKKGEVLPLLFFSETPVEKYSCKEEDAVLDELVSIRPEYQKVRKTEIPLMEVDGQNITLEAWAEKMRLGIFAVPNVADEVHLDHGVGVVRTKEA